MSENQLKQKVIEAVGDILLEEIFINHLKEELAIKENYDHLDQIAERIVKTIFTTSIDYNRKYVYKPKANLLIKL